MEKDKIDWTVLEPGYYWAKKDEYKWYNFIVEIYGNKPFLKLRGWNLMTDKVLENIEPNSFAAISRIEKPQSEDKVI